MFKKDEKNRIIAINDLNAKDEDFILEIDRDNRKDSCYTNCLCCNTEVKKYEESVEVEFKGSNEFLCLNCWENSKEYKQNKEVKI